MGYTIGAMEFKGVVNKYTGKERFWTKVRVGESTECWPWQASLYPDGYGMFAVDSRPRHAHRVAYELAFGELPADRQVHHCCGNPRCVNPAHLSSLRAAEHARLHNPRNEDCTRCGEPLEPAVRWICRPCDAQRAAEYRAKNLEAVRERDRLRKKRAA
jgi:hypothetical protein